MRSEKAHRQHPDHPELRLADPVETAYDKVLDVALEELENDPYPVYRWVRNVCPIVYAPSTGRVMITTWGLCREAGFNEAVFGPTTVAHETVYGRPNVMSMTGSAHLAIRNAAAAPVRPQPVRSIRETRIRPTAVRYIDAIRDRGAAEVTTELIEPIAMRIVADVLGFVDIDDATLRRWFYALAEYLVDYGRDAAIAERARAVKAELADYLQQRRAAILQSRAGSALFRLFQDGMPEGRTRPAGEILPTVGVLIVGGFQEPAHAISNTLLGLFSRPEQAARMAASPSTWSRAAIEEGLRWLPPFGMTEKLTSAEITLGGVRIPANTEIALVIGSANRDPTRFDHPDDFDIDRPNQGNVTFGFGSHFCIGHNIARTLGEIVLEEMFRRLPNLRLDGQRKPLVHGWFTRAAKKLPLLWDA